METDQIETKTLIVSLVPIVIIETASRAVISEGLGHPMIILGAARLFETIAIILIVLSWGKGVSSIGLTRSRIVFGLKKGLIWSSCFAMAASLAFAALFLAGINPMAFIKTHLPARPGEILLFFFVGGMIAPVAEELFFRGMLYGFFRRWGVVAALVLSTLIFVLSHSINRGIPVTQMVGGIVFAISYEVEGNLMVPITIHVLGNTAIFTLSLIF